MNLTAIRTEVEAMIAAAGVPLHLISLDMSWKDGLLLKLQFAEESAEAYLKMEDTIRIRLRGILPFGTEIRMRCDAPIARESAIDRLDRLANAENFHKAKTDWPKYEMASVRFNGFINDDGKVFPNALGLGETVGTYSNDFTGRDGMKNIDVQFEFAKPQINSPDDMYAQGYEDAMHDKGCDPKQLAEDLAKAARLFDEDHERAHRLETALGDVNNKLTDLMREHTDVLAENAKLRRALEKKR